MSILKRTTVTTPNAWIGIHTTPSFYSAHKPACGLAAAVRTTAPKRQDIGSPLEPARGQSAGGLHHHTTAPPVTAKVTFAKSVRSYSNNSAGLPLHADTSLKQRGATLIPGRPPLQQVVMTTQVPSCGRPLADLRVPRQQAPHPSTLIMDKSVPRQQATPFGPAGHSQAQLSQHGKRHLAARHLRTRGS